MSDEFPPGYQENKWQPLLRRYWDLTIGDRRIEVLNALGTSVGIVGVVYLLGFGVLYQLPIMWVSGIALAIVVAGNIGLMLNGFKARDRLDSAWTDHHQKNILSLSYQMLGIEKSLADARAGVNGTVVAGSVVE